jgi:hypothetical protein
MSIKQTTGGGFTAHAITSPEGAAILVQQRISVYDLAKAITAYIASEGVRFGTFIGIHDSFGVFCSEDAGWRPDAPDAFTRPFGVIPWVQIHELLGKLPEGTTADYLDPNGTID